jgi:cyanoexosortase A
MKAIHFPALDSLKSPPFWLLGIGSSLITIHLSLTNREGNRSLFALSLLFWFVASSLVWKKRDSLNFNSGIFASTIGLLIIAAVLLKSATLPTSNFLGVSPFLSALGLSLLASGGQGLKQYWRELTVLFFLNVPKVLLWPVVDISKITAKFATFILWYGGFDVYRSGFDIMLPKGGVNVNMGCSGLEGIFYLLGLAVLFLILYPLQELKKKIIVPLVAVAIAFFVNGFRVALMAILANAQDRKGLDYWHVGDGSLIFSMLCVGLFGLFCYFLLRLENVEPQTTEKTLDL